MWSRFVTVGAAEVGREAGRNGDGPPLVPPSMRKRIGFLSFGHYRDVPGSRVPTAGDSLRTHVDLAVAAE